MTRTCGLPFELGKLRVSDFSAINPEGLIKTNLRRWMFII
jgi:hypothetical protein